MPTVIAHHDIRIKRDEIFGPLGVTDMRTFVNPPNPTHVAGLMDGADVDKLTAAMSTPELAAAMERGGVLAETLVILVEA